MSIKSVIWELYNILNKNNLMNNNKCPKLRGKSITWITKRKRIYFALLIGSEYNGDIIYHFKKTNIFQIQLYLKLFVGTETF